MCCDVKRTWGKECERGWKGQKVRTTSHDAGWKSVSEQSQVSHTHQQKPLRGLNKSASEILCGCSEGQTDWDEWSWVPHRVTWLPWPQKRYVGAICEFNKKWKENYKIKTAAALQALIDKRLVKCNLWGSLQWLPMSSTRWHWHVNVCSHVNTFGPNKHPKLNLKGSIDRTSRDYYELSMSTTLVVMSSVQYYAVLCTELNSWQPALYPSNLSWT